MSREVPMKYLVIVLLLGSVLGGCASNREVMVYDTRTHTKVPRSQFRGTIYHTDDASERQLDIWEAQDTADTALYFQMTQPIMF